MHKVASPQTSFGVRLSRLHFWERNEYVTNEPQRTSAGRLCTRGFQIQRRGREKGGGGFGDKKKGNMKDMQGRLYIVLLVNTLLTQNSLDFVQRATRTNTTNTKELRTNFISQQRICRYVARLLVSRNDGSSRKRRKTILLVALNCSIEQPINMENYRKELLSGVYCYES